MIVLASYEAFQTTHIMKNLFVVAMKLYDNFRHRFANNLRYKMFASILLYAEKTTIIKIFKPLR